MKTHYRPVPGQRHNWQCEFCAYIIIPEQEAAVRTPAFQERYARAVVDGLEAYFRALAR